MDISSALFVAARRGGNEGMFSIPNSATIPSIGYVISARATPQPVLAKVCIYRLGKRGIARVILKGADGGDPF